MKTIGNLAIGTGKLDLNFVNEGPIYHPGTEDWSSLAARRPFFAVVNSHENEYDIYDRQSAKKERVTWVGEDEHEKPPARSTTGLSVSSMSPRPRSRWPALRGLR